MVERQSPGTPSWSRADWSATLQLTVAAAIVATPLLALAALYGVGPRVPRFIELIGWLAFGWVLLGRLRAPSADSALARPVTRSMGAALCALLAAHYFWLARLPAWLRDETSAELASRTSAVLSTTWHGLPWYGLTYAWGTCAFAWLVRALVVDAWPRLTPPRLHAAGPGLGLAALVLTLGLGALAVLGYATGSPWLWPG